MALILSLCSPCAALAAPLLPPALLAAPFRDHAVLQRDRPLSVWGTAKPGESVTVTLAGQRVNGRADGKGKWQVNLAALPAGGPYTLEAATASDRQTVTDVLVGDVFLCSGQSNMQWTMKGILGADALIASAANDRLRMMTVAQAQAMAPATTFEKPAEWQLASPQTVPNWSAVCYTFARDLQRTTQVPVGLINVSWGGSRIEPWMTAAGLKSVGGHETGLDLLARYGVDPVAASEAYGRQFTGWWTKSGGEGTPWAVTPAERATWPKVPDVSQNWEDWGVPELAAYDGPVWYTATVTLTAAQAQAQAGATLNLGPIDEFDTTFVNGVAVGYTSGPGTPRAYRLPAGRLRAGENLIAINAVDTWGKGGLYGASARELVLADGVKLPLSDWRFRKAGASVRFPPRAPWDATGGLTTIHNAMIAPLGPYGLKGALWYQGESNAGESSTYQALLNGLMGDWRTQFGPDLPFLVVQLAEYGPRPTKPVESGWAGLREAQRQAVLKDGNAALVVTTDVGNPNDIHPIDKNTVGLRLARAARRLIYKENITPSGPVPSAVLRAEGRITVRFRDIDGALVSYGTRYPANFELCGDDRKGCQYVAAEIRHDTVILTGPAVAAAKFVRYCWADSAICTLYDKALPAGPFEMAVQ